MKMTHAELHNDKAFAMLHDASAIRESRWEGMQREEAIAYLSGIMNHPDPLLHLGLPAKHLDLVRNAFEDLMEFTKLFKSFPLTADGIVIDYKQVIALIHARAAMKNGIAYMPTGWIGQPGHFVAAKLQLVSDNVFKTSYLQQGSGVQYHQPMVKTEYKTKLCYQSDPMLIDFDTKLGENFLLGTVSLNYDTRILNDFKGQDNEVKKFSEVDLYALLRLTGTPVPEYVPDSRQAVTPQRVGSCALTNAKIVANDVLIFLCNFSVNKIKRYTFGLKMNSLQVAIDAYAEGKCDEKLLIWALREANVRINKHYPEIITVHECTISNQLIQNVHIKQHVVDQPLPKLVAAVEPILAPPLEVKMNDNNKEKESKHINKLLPGTYTLRRLDPGIQPHQLAAEVAATNHIYSKINKFVTSKVSSPSLKNLSLNQKFEAISSYENSVKDITGLRLRLEFCQFIRSLPKTSGYQDDQFWDQVPHQHQIKIVESLWLMLTDQYHGLRIDMYGLESTMIVYDIAAQIAIKHPDLMLDNIYSLGFSDVIPPSLRFINPDIYYNVKQVLLNFKNRCLSKKAIFTNTVGYEKDGESMMQYIQSKILTLERRRMIVKFLIASGDLSPNVVVENVPDIKFIAVILTGGDILPPGVEQYSNVRICGVFFALALNLSARVHLLGFKSGRYFNSNELDHFYFNKESRFISDITISKEIDKAEKSQSVSSILINRLPTIALKRNDSFYDVAENLIAHPLSDLRRLNKDIEKQADLTVPYQFRYSGTFHVSGNPWLDVTNNIRLESLDEEFRRIEATGKLTVLVLLEWLSSRFGELELPLVRRRVTELLFSFGQLDYVLGSYPDETLRLLNIFLHAALSQSIDNLPHADSNQIAVFHFLCNLQFQLSRHIAIASRLYDFNIRKFKPVYVRKILTQNLLVLKDTYDRVNNAKLLIFSFVDQPPAQMDDFLYMFKSYLMINIVASAEDLLANDPIGCLEDYVYEVWQTYLPKLIAYIKHLSEDDLSSFMNLVLDDIFPLMQKKSSWQFRDRELHCTNQKGFYFLLDRGWINFKGQRVFDSTAALKLLPIVKGLPLDHQTVRFFDIENSANPNQTITMTSDGRWRLFRAKHSNIIDEILMRVIIDAKDYHFRVMLDGNNHFAAPVNSPFGKEYLYASNTTNQNQLFAQSFSTIDRAALYTKQSGWLYLKQDKTKSWQTTSLRRLDFCNPQSALEHAWKLALDQSIGSKSMRSSAKLTNDSNLILSDLYTKLFKLTFRNSEGTLMSFEYPGFYWRQIKRLPCLSRLKTLIILENNEGQYKYLLPPYKLKNAEVDGKNRNKALSSEDFINYEEALDYPNCFEYELDRNGELCGKSDDANLYLAIIYRCLGDYRRAMFALKSSESLARNTTSQVNIAKLTMSWPDLSALGAAFDCQLFVRIYSHSFKRSEGYHQALANDDRFFKYALEQLEWYRCNYSTRKKGISIIPEYMRLTADELKNFAGIDSVLNKDRGAKREYSNDYLLPLFPKVNIIALNRTFQSNLINADFIDFLNSEMLAKYSKQDSAYTFSVRVFPSGYHYLLRYFVNLCEDALSTDKNTERRLIARLFMLANNDAKNESVILILLLTAVLQHKDIFKSLKNQNITTTKNCIRSILQLGVENKVCLRESIIPLELKRVDLAGSIPEHETLTTAAKCQFSLNSYHTPLIHEAPYSAIARKYLIAKKIPIATNPTMDSLMVGGSKIEYRLMAHYYEGNTINKDQHKIEYQWLNEKLALEYLHKELTHSRNKDQASLKKLKDELLNIANTAHSFKGTAEEAYYQASCRGEQRNSIGIPELLRALLNQDCNDLLKMNPFLKQSHIDSLMAGIVKYACIKIRIDQADAAMKLNSNEIQKIGQLLSSERYYDVAAYPEFLVYEYATKRLLRLDQVKSLCTLINLIEENAMHDEKYRHALLQFAAGGGKTAVLIPILVQRFARKGFLPVIINTNEMYSIAVHEIPSNLRFAFNIQVEVIERGLEHQWHLQDLTQLYNDLMRWQSERKCLLLKPVTWHSINIAATMGYENKTIELAQAAEKVLDFFSERTVVLEDEGQITSDPLQKNIKTHGGKLTLGREQLQLIIDIYEHLLGVAPNSRKIAELAGIIDKSKKLHTDQEVENLQGMLVERMLGFEVFRAYKNTDIKHYFLQPGKTKPQWLQALRSTQPNHASLIVLGRAFIKTLLPHILTLQYNTNFGFSINDGDLTAAPMREGKHVTSHYADQILVASLTIQLYYLSGIPRRCLSGLLINFKQEHIVQSQSIKSELTPAEQRLNSILPKSVGFVSLNKLSKQRIDEICLNPEVLKSFDILKEFLFRIVHEQLSTSEYRVESTAADYQAGLRRRIVFSATPGLRELYFPTVTKEHYHELLSFEAEVFATLLREKNAEACMIDMTTDLYQFFYEIKSGYPDFFSKVQALFDSGALISDEKPARVAKILMRLLDDTDKPSATMYFNKGNMVFQSKLKQLHGVTAPGTNLVELLARYDIKPESLLIFLFLDLSKTTGTDMTRPINDCAAITIGKGQTLSSTIQAAMRERQLLQENAQTVKWIIFRSLYAIISPNEERFDLQKVCYWMITNDAKCLENKVINRAYQVINQVLIAEAKKLIRKNPHHYEKVRHVLQQKQVIDPYLLYEIESVQEQPKKVLRDYAASLSKDLQLGRNFKLPQSSALLLESAINETSDLVALMSSPHGAELNAQVCQEQQQVVQQMQEIMLENLLTVGGDFKFKMEVYSPEIDSLQAIFSDKCQYAPMRIKFPGVKHNIAIPEIFINLAHFQPYEHIREKVYLSYLKPFQALLVTIVKGKHAIHIVGCTSAGIQYFAYQIKRVNANSDFHHALIGKNGHIMCASNNIIGSEDKKLIERMKAVRRAVVFCALLNGEVKSVNGLVDLIKHYKWSEQDFNELIKVITTLHLSRTGVNLNNIPNLAELCGWKSPHNAALLKNLPIPSEQKQATQAHYTVIPRAPSPRWSAARLNYQPRSVLSGVLFKEAPRSTMDLPVEDVDPPRGFVLSDI